MCTLYGFIVVILMLTLKDVENTFIVFGASMIYSTVIQYLTGKILAFLNKKVWWDYSNKPLNFHGYICLEFSLIWGLAIVMVVKVFQKYVERQASHTPSTLEWVVMAILYAVYLADFIVTVAVIRGLNKKLTRLDKVRADLRIVSDKLSDTLATTTIDTAQKVGEGKVQVALAKAELRDATVAQKERSAEMLRMKKAELQAQFDELSSSITNHTVFGQGRILKAFPEMKHRDYFELIQELKKKLR